MMEISQSQSGNCTNSFQFYYRILLQAETLKQPDFGICYLNVQKPGLVPMYQQAAVEHTSTDISMTLTRDENCKTGLTLLSVWRFFVFFELLVRFLAQQLSICRQQDGCFGSAESWPAIHPAGIWIETRGSRSKSSSHKRDVSAFVCNTLNKGVEILLYFE